jgi:DNA mismatch repair ATPase MutS
MIVRCVGEQEEHLKRIPDLDRLSKKFQKGKASLQDAVSIYQFILRLPLLCEALASYQGTQRDLVETQLLAPLQVEFSSHFIMRLHNHAHSNAFCLSLHVSACLPVCLLFCLPA